MSSVSSLNRVLTQLRDRHIAPAPVSADAGDADRPFRVLTVTSNKGGVGKTTLATNLAIYFRALRPDLQVLLLGLDDQVLIDRMFAGAPQPDGQTVLSALRAGSLTRAIRLGQYGVHYVASSPDVAQLKGEIDGPLHLQAVLRETGWRGLVIVDTKSDLEILTQNAIAASDLTLVPVEDQSSLDEAQKVFDLIESWGHPRTRARVLLSLVDRRIKYSNSESGDILGLLVSEIRTRKLPLFESFISRSPKIQSLATHPNGRAASILHGARHSLVHRQMRHVANDVLTALGAATINDQPTEPWCDASLRYRLGDDLSDHDDGDLFRELEPRYPEFFAAALDATARHEPPIEALRADLEHEPADRRCFDALNAMALAYFRIQAEQRDVGSRLELLRISLRSANVCAELPRIYNKTSDPSLRNAILDFFEDTLHREKATPGRMPRRLVQLVESMQCGEGDSQRIASLRVRIRVDGTAHNERTTRGWD